jgi:inosose dehydratase
MNESQPSKTKSITRRDALKAAMLAAMGLPLLNGLPGWATETNADGKTLRHSPLNLGLASFSLSTFSVEDLIAALKQLQLTNVALFKSHCPWSGTPEECRAVVMKFKAAGIKVTGSGVIYLTNNETAVRKAFDNARAAGLPTMDCSPSLDAFPLVEKFVKEYDIRLAIHNHGPEDKTYPSPYDVWKAIQPYDKRIGMCLDVGHSARIGADPVEVIHKCHERLYDLHMKDSNTPVGTPHDNAPVEVGRGLLNIKGILSALIEIKYSNIVSFEYEKTTGDRMAGLKESVEFVRHAISQLES